ncbi:hypothetical protein AAG570_004647, partial [Ranatra chinensis]
WLAAHGNRYHSVDVQLTHSGGSGGQSDVIQGEEGVAHWPKARYSHVIHLREEALTFARRIWADYLWMLDCDVFITNPVTLTHLVSLRRTVVAPMLRSDGLYSNFWCGMTPELYYMRTDSYTPILNRKSKGCHRVPMVHSAVLLDLRAVESDGLTYSPDRLLGYAGPRDDIITFARSANMTGVNMYVCNEEIYGYIMVPLEKDDQLSYDLLQLRNLKLEILADGPPLEPSSNLEEFLLWPEDDSHVRDSLVEKVYMISLLRRPERRLRMEQCFRELNLTSVTVDAVDGK